MARWREQLHQKTSQTPPVVTLFDTIELKGGGKDDIATCGIAGIISMVVTMVLLLVLRPPIVVWKSKTEKVSCLKPGAVLGIALLSGLAAGLLTRYGWTGALAFTRWIFFSVRPKKKRKRYPPMLINSLDECQTKEDVKSFFGNFRNTDRAPPDAEPFTPKSDAQFALRKLRPSNPFIRASLCLDQDQVSALSRIDESHGNNWDAYCDALSLEQIKCVGW